MRELVLWHAQSPLAVSVQTCGEGPGPEAAAVVVVVVVVAIAGTGTKTRVSNELMSAERGGARERVQGSEQ